jgi:death-on-curing protein
VNEPTWVERVDLDTMHQQQICEHGGPHGVRDEGLLDSALARARNLFLYGGDEIDLAALAASYGCGLTKNHGYIDGNKRIAFMSMFAFLRVNEERIQATEPEVVTLMMSLADGTVNDTALAAWLRTHTVSVEHR